MWQFDNDVPIYLQISNEVINRIIIGQYQSGDRLPTVRELAKEFGVNPNTVQKALIELDQRSIIESRRTIGNFISEDIEYLNSLKQVLVDEAIDKYLDRMATLNYSKNQAIESILKRKDEE